MGRLAALDGLVRQSPDQQVSLTDPDARSMATCGRGSGVVGYDVQVAVEAEHHLIVAHEVTNVIALPSFRPAQLLATKTSPSASHSAASCRPT